MTQKTAMYLRKQIDIDVVMKEKLEKLAEKDGRNLKNYIENQLVKLGSGEYILTPAKKNG